MLVRARGGEWGATAHGNGVSSGGDRNVLELDSDDRYRTQGIY